MSLTEVESMVKSCVLSKKGDMTINELKEEYYELVGQQIPFKKLGCDTLEALLNKLSGISTKKNSSGQLIVLACSKKSAHIADLVNRQNASKKTRNVKGKISYAPRKASRAPVQNISKTNHSLHRSHESKGKTLKPLQMHSTNNIPSSSFDHTLRKKSKSRKPSNRRCLSSTQVRYIPAGEENDSFEDEFDFPSAKMLIKNNFQHLSSTQVKYIPAGEENDYFEEDFDHPSADMLIKDKFVHQQPIAKFESNIVPKARQTRSMKNDFVSGQHRVVSMTGNTLRCTVSVNPLPQSRDKKLSTLTSTSTIVRCGTQDTRCHSSWDNGPVILGYNLVGDDFLLQFAYECLQVQCEWEDLEGLACGMCMSGQTIHDFHMHMRREGFIQTKLMLMLGSVDILQGTSLRSIIEDTTDLLDDITSSPVESLVLLTLPFLKTSDVVVNRKVSLFNDFLRTLDNGHRLHVLDTHHLFNKRSLQIERTYENCINPKCYEGVARDILCYPRGVVLWSHIGRTHLFNFLLQELTELNNKNVITK